MKKIVLIATLFFSLSMMADTMNDILEGAYTAKSISVEAQDSLLNGGAAVQGGQNETLTGKVYELRFRNKQSLFRRSFVADYYLWDVNKQVEIPLSDRPVRDAKMSPNGKYVVYAKGQNLYIYKVDFNSEIAITNDSSHIFNGISDWLYEEEFGVTSMFAFSPDSKQVVFVRLDETQVPTFTWQNYLTDDNYPQLESLRYPKAGTPNAVASVCVYDIYYKSIKTLNIGEDDDRYIPRVWWTNTQETGKVVKPAEVVVEIINRDQNELRLLACNAKSTVSHLLYREKSDKYFFDYSLMDNSLWLSDNRFILLSEKEGYRRLYMMNSDGSMNKCLTPQDRDVTALYGVNEKTGYVYYQAAPTPETRCVYALQLKKMATSLIGEPAGINSLHLGNDGIHAILCHESNTMPNQYRYLTLNPLPSFIGKGEVADYLADVNAENKAIQQQWQTSGIPDKEFFTFRTERGDELRCWRILPPHFDANQRYPVVLMQYSGPASQQVLDRWRKRFGHYLASVGYIVVNADPRGTDCRGRAWRNTTYMNLGEKEAEDQLSMAQYMAKQPYVDATRIAMLGWSYGGYQTIRTMCEQSEPIIRCGVAIAPVTDWRLYDTGYTERYMQRPQVNEFGYDAASLMNKADRLQGRLLIMHGLSDDNVHAQNTLLLTEALVNAGKQFDMQLYVDDNHFLKKGNHYRHVHDKIIEFLQKELK